VLLLGVVAARIVVKGLCTVGYYQIAVADDYIEIVVVGADYHIEVVVEIDRIVDQIVEADFANVEAAVAVDIAAVHHHYAAAVT